MSKKKKILILGATGQDGSFMSKFLLEKNYSVHGMIRRTATGNLSNIKASDKYYFKRKYYSMIKDFFEDQYKIFSCKVNNLTISSLLVLYTTNYAHCHLIGSNEFARKLSANNLLHHEVIKWCRRKKIKFLHFGGGYTNEDKDPVLKFKKSFSNQENYFYVGERIINESQYKKICSNIDDKNLFNNNKLLKYRDV